MSFEQNVRTMLRERAGGVAAAPLVPDATARRIRKRKALQVGGVAAAAVAVVAVAGVFTRSAFWSDAAPAPPADEVTQEIEPMRNGRIVTSVNGRQEWHAFDQDTGSFFFFSYLDGRSTVLREDGPVAAFDCPPSADCELASSFGPGATELTVPVRDRSGDLLSVQVIGFDGRVRDELDISAAVATTDVNPAIQDHRLTDLAWSPDGSRLAISTEPNYICEGSSLPCESKVWIFDRGRSEPQLVFTERASDDLVDGQFIDVPLLTELAWSPDGHSLSLLVVSEFLFEGNNRGSPRLVVLRLQPDQPVRAETLHVYDDVKLPAWNDTTPRGLLFASAWSPDGTRIAVTSEGGIAEISAEDGRVQAQHRVNPSLVPGAASPGTEGGYGLLAWLPKE